MAPRVAEKPPAEIEIGDSPDDAAVGFWQQYRWAYGVFSVWRYRRTFAAHFAKDKPGLKIRAWIIAFGHLEGIASWNAVSYVFVLLVWQAACGHILALAFLASYLLEFLICVFWFSRGKLLPTRSGLIAPYALFVDLLRRSFPANLALFDYCLGIHRNLTKTEHAADVVTLS